MGSAGIAGQGRSTPGRPHRGYRLATPCGTGHSSSWPWPCCSRAFCGLRERERRRPLGGAAAIVTAPITAPVLFIEARRNGRGAFLERARNNRRPAPLLDPVSEEMAAATLELALDRGEPDRGVYWENNRDAHGRRAGGVTVLATWHTEAGRTCREVLVETVAEGRPTDQRVRIHCQDEKGSWEALGP